MKNGSPKTIYLKDYKPLSTRPKEVHLTFNLDDEETLVTATTVFEGSGEGPLRLNGEELTLLSVKLDGRRLGEEEYRVDEKGLVIEKVPAVFTLEVVTRISPKGNTALMGLYKSGAIFCTQNEPEGFRRITYFLDRPDAMATFTTKIVGDKRQCPIMLSNGNETGRGELQDGRHWAEWHDPFPKPCYLFALVAGDLDCLEDSFTTRSGKEVKLRIFSDRGSRSKCFHAMESLKKSMKWDEELFGLEYDLDVFMIVAVDSFNFGAMENKGLNIFNSSYVLADDKSATDNDYMGIERVIAHEYFHNWTGNRVTCRDWFQLTLKEGLTVFRDQEFTADMHSRAVKRIEDVVKLRSYQFAEDAGPMAHPIQPKSYISINNFYTVTVYEKGAEVIRMIFTLIGREAFRKGIEKYFELYDGQAVTTEDFVRAMEIASGRDLSHFSQWYHQSGTPEVEVEYSYDEENSRFVLHLKQATPATPDQKEKKPLLFPLTVGLAGKEGGDLPLETETEGRHQGGSMVLTLDKEEERVVFEGVKERPVPSLNRGFSAPVKLSVPYSREELLFLMARDADPFNRWDAGQQLAKELILEQVERLKQGEPVAVDPRFIEAVGSIIEDETLDPLFKTEALKLPGESTLGQMQTVIDFDPIHEVRQTFCRTIAESHFEKLFLLHERWHEKGAYKLDADSIGKRSIKNCALSYLLKTERQEAVALAFKQFEEASNMTDEFAALAALSQCDCPEKQEALSRFFEKWKHEMLVICKWFGVQASSPLPGALSCVKKLEAGAPFNMKVPNFVRALYGSFIGNQAQFNAKNGEGYSFLADRVLKLDKINPHISAGLAKGFSKYGKLDSERKGAMKKELDRIVNSSSISQNVYEIVSKTLAN